MKRNRGTTDRVIRAVVMAPALLVIAYLVGFATVVGVIATVLAILMLGTAAEDFCPLYVPFHLHIGHRGDASA